MNLVTAVIPTWNRPDLVLRAVRSALAQDHDSIEVIVVIDGPDAKTNFVLSEVHDHRLKVIVLDTHIGGAGTRNIGVRAAQGKWIAFLDDDDEWLPNKISAQLGVAANSNALFPVISCRMFARTPFHQYIWPRRLPSASEPISEYLLARRSLFQGEGTVTTTTLLAPRALLLKIPFGADQQRHQEWDWLLRALVEPGTKLEFAPEPLSVWHIDEARTSISARNNWRYSYEWIERMRPFITPRAYAAFLLTLVTSLAARAGDWRAYGKILISSLRRGRPAPIDLLLFCGMVTVPQSYRRRLRALFSS